MIRYNPEVVNMVDIRTIFLWCRMDFVERSNNGSSYFVEYNNLFLNFLQKKVSFAEILLVIIQCNKGILLSRQPHFQVAG